VIRQAIKRQTVLLPHIIRGLVRVPLDSHGRSHAIDEHGNKVITGHYVPGLPVWRFELLFYPSYRYFDTDIVRAKDAGDAKLLIKQRYPNAVQYDFDVGVTINS
jgi:hypothetical protein